MPDLTSNKNRAKQIEDKLKTAIKFVQVEKDKCEQRMGQLDNLLIDLQSVELSEEEDNF
jgi:hypothetical protein